MTVFCFRHRLHLPVAGKLTFDESTVLLSREGARQRITLRSAKNDRPLREVDEVALVGEGFETADEARTAGETWRGILERSFAAVQVGADFGDRAPKGGFDSGALERVDRQTGQRVLNDEHGLVIYECSPQPVFMRLGAVGFAPLAKESWRRALETAVDQEPLSSRHRLAYDLYSTSYFVSETPDAKFMMLMMSLETLIEQEEKNEIVRSHVNRLITLTKSANLAETDKNSLLGALQWLNRESVTKAGQRLADTLGNHRYGGMTPREFFKHCYNVRSQLAHGHVRRPSRQDVVLLTGDLQRFVGDLIAGPAVVAAASPSPDGAGGVLN